MISSDAFQLGASATTLRPEMNGYEWEQCANEGEEICQCGCKGSGKKMVRFGSPGHGDEGWAVKTLSSAEHEVLCASIYFDHKDPLPGVVKRCECTHVVGGRKKKRLQHSQPHAFNTKK